MTNFKIVAMLATHDRSDLLLKRALPSVLGQSRPADELVVVDDGEDEGLADRIRGLASRAYFLRNRRTRGLSGALNSGLDQVLRTASHPERVYVAFLDDDDAWLPMHLEAVERCIHAGAQTIATPFLRVETGREPLLVAPPSRLITADFHKGNPGLQGSNLVARLDILLEAGGFNEALSSCTDRDLCIRFSRRSALRHEVTDEPSVLHFACEDRPRLSSRGSDAKRQGLTMFDVIHGTQMARPDREVHLDRASRLFDWYPPEREPRSQPDLSFVARDVDESPLVIGIIADPERAASLERLLHDLAQAVVAESMSPPEVVLLENGREEAGARFLTCMLAQFSGCLSIRLIDHAALQRIRECGEWHPIGGTQAGKYAIADARTALQSCLYHMACERPGCTVWILDDDMRLDPICSAGDRLDKRTLKLGAMIGQARATGANIAIGAYTGAAPLPAAATVRVQLVDLLWNLRRFGSSPSDAPMPLAEPHNSALRVGRRDYYYDLSRVETDRLETPFALEPARAEETCGEALNRLGDMIPRLLAGDVPLRPLVADTAEISAFKTGQALHRGGNTFVFDPEALADLPNLAPTVGKRATRRSDMIWSLLQRERLGRSVVSVPVHVRHDRTDMSVPDQLDHAGLADDLRGFAIFNALAEGGVDAPERVEALCAKFETERLAALQLSFFRIRGLARELLSWIETDAPAHAPKDNLRRQAQTLLGLFSEEGFATIRSEVKALGGYETRHFLHGIDEQIAGYRDQVRNASEIPRLLAELRTTAAMAAVAAQVSKKLSLRVLGGGNEGVALTDGRSVWKLFDRWTAEQASRTVPVLRRLIAAGSIADALKGPLALTATPVGWLMEMPFEETAPYAGGVGPGLIELLADLHRHGVHCCNLHPDNLRVVDGKVRLIDWGADLVEHDDLMAQSEGFANMCRRAWLCWRFSWREDLKELMHRSLREPDLPELSGSEGLLHAVQERLGVLHLVDPMMELALALSPLTVLDYGAGKGKQAAQLASNGAQVVAWDPDPEVADRLDRLVETGVRRAGSAAEAVAGGAYDLVICRRVVCLLDDAALDMLLCDLRLAVSDKGRVLLGFCHPAYAYRVRTAEADPCEPRCACGAKHWRKRVRGTGRILEEVLRPERLIRRLVRRAGFRIVGRHERFCIEFDRFETVSDLLVLVLVPVQRPQTALLVKACAMDAHTLEEQVRSLLTATEGPSGFSEIILTIDTRTSGFLRAHAPGDLALLRASAEGLRAAGEVDRIVETPSDPATLRALNRRWFGLDLAATHTESGAATSALLVGFDACATRFVLHADVDMMVGRGDRDLDTIADLIGALEADPLALTAAFPVAGAAPLPWAARGPDGPWRVESRLGLVDLERMEKILPLPNDVEGDAPCLSWHRAMDRAVTLGSGSSLRGGDVRVFCVHPPNARKHATEDWAEVREAISRGLVPLSQRGQIEWTSEVTQWRRPERRERFVFVICGRNVPPERFRRCWQSVTNQSRDDWGAVIIDDASAPEIAEEIGHIIAPHAARVSWIARQQRVGLLANTVHAIRHLCADPNQIIVTLDADDHLIGSDVLCRLAEAYEAGTDLTVGSMLRTDKHTDYPVCFIKPRLHRGGNVWQHLRTFRKSLFDAVPDTTLRLDGEFVELASDWAFMLPMVEMAQKPHWISASLYLHEPGEQRRGARATERESVITRLIATHSKNEYLI